MVHNSKSQTCRIKHFQADIETIDNKMRRERQSYQYTKTIKRKMEKEQTKMIAR